MTDTDTDTHEQAEQIAALGKALGGEEKSASVGERYPEAPPELHDTIEELEAKLDNIEERLAEKERKKEKRAAFVAGLVEKVEELEAKLDQAEEHYGI